MRNKYCVAYYGPYNEFIWQLIYLKPIIEKQLPDLQLYISCKDEMKAYLDADYIISQSDLTNHLFVYIRKLTFDNVNHPIESFIKESKIALTSKEIHEIRNIQPKKDENSLSFQKLIPEFKIFECY